MVTHSAARLTGLFLRKGGNSLYYNDLVWVVPNRGLAGLIEIRLFGGAGKGVKRVERDEGIYLGKR